MDLGDVADPPVIDRCGGFWHADKKVVGMRRVLPCDQTKIGQIPEYLHLNLAGDPDLNAFGRKNPILMLDVQKRPMTQIDTMVTIPVYNTGEVLLNTLPSLFALTTGAWELIVVLDACYDHSYDIVVKLVELHFASSSCVRVRLVEQETAVYETSANNIAMRMSSPTNAYVLMQGDMLITEAGWNERMWEPFARDPKVFAVSARCCHSRPPAGGNNVGRCGNDIGEPLEDGYDRVAFEIRETCNRGPLMVHAARTQELGFLDEKHFVFEDDEHDLIRRSAEVGYVAGYYPVGFHAPLDWSSRRNDQYMQYAPGAVQAAERAYLAQRRKYARAP